MFAKPLTIAENGRCPGAQHRPGSCLWPSGLPHDRLLFWKSMRFYLGRLPFLAIMRPIRIRFTPPRFMNRPSISSFLLRWPGSIDANVLMDRFLPFTCWPMPFCGRSMSISGGLRCRSEVGIPYPRASDRHPDFWVWHDSLFHLSAPETGHQRRTRK